MDAKRLMIPKKEYKKSRSPADYGKRAEWCGGICGLKRKTHSRLGKSKRERAYPPICGLQTGGRP